MVFTTNSTDQSGLGSATLPDDDAEPVGHGPIAVYVHWPFCRALCPYCDFNVHIQRDVDHDRWCRAYLAEIDHYAAVSAHREITSVYFGGGTPSLMDPDVVAAVIERACSTWRPSADFEVSLEANPNSADSERFAAYQAAGVSRLSVGVQSLDDNALAVLGRDHNRAEAIRAIEHGQRYFPHLSFDLIHTRPGQGLAAWRRELAEAADLAGDHLSAYQLTIEPGTAFHAAQCRGTLTMPCEDLGAAMYEATQEILAAAGLPAYEVSNHARAGGMCRHNLTYWRYGDYVGIGPSAHGRLLLGEDKVVIENIRGPQPWLAAVEGQGHGTAGRHRLTRTVRGQEMLIMGLRLVEGVSRARFRREVGLDIETALDDARLTPLVETGFLCMDGDSLRATAAGHQRLDAILARLIG